MQLAELIEQADPTFWPACRAARLCDIDEEFMGFTDVYANLAAIIPKGRIIVDLGCAYAPQAIYFQEHRKYIGVDLGHCPQVRTKNSEYHNDGIADWIEKELPKYDQRGLFAICSYVPPWHNDNEELVRRAFKHLFVFYSTSGDHPEWGAEAKAMLDASPPHERTLTTCQK